MLADGEDYARGRPVLAAALDRKFDESFLPQIANRSRILLEQLPARGSVELMEQLVLPLARESTLELLGVPEVSQADVRRLLCHGLTFAFHEGEYLLRYPFLLGRDERTAAGYRREIRQVFSQLLRTGERQSIPGVLAALRSAVARGQILSEVATLLAEGVMAASFEPLAHQLGNSLLALARRSELYDRLRQNPAQVGPAVKEFERFDPAVQAIFRYVREEVVLKGETLCAGEQIILLLGSANRDPRLFSRPDEIDIDRPERQQFTFGRGAHACLGVRITRAVHQIVLTGLFNRYSSLKLAGRPAWRSNLPMRGLRSLPVAVS